MPTEDGFPPDHPFLSGHADEHEERCSLLLLNASILVLVASLIGMVIILSFGNPAKVFADIKASLVDIAAFQPGTGQSPPIIQSTEALPPTATDAPTVSPGANPESAPLSDGKTAARDVPTRDEIAAAPEPADQSQTEIREPSADALFKQFQAWVAEEDARAQVVQPVQNARAQIRPMQKHPHVQPVQNAQAEIRPERKPRAKEEQNARVQVRPAQNAPAQNQSVQNAQAPSFLQSFGGRN
jgi:hypothetical protein